MMQRSVSIDAGFIIIKLINKALKHDRTIKRVPLNVLTKNSTVGMELSDSGLSIVATDAAANSVLVRLSFCKRLFCCIITFDG